MHREALRVRARWVQELMARVASRLGERARGDVGDLRRADLVRHLWLAELADVVAGRPAPAALAGRAAAIAVPPLPAVFQLTAEGVPVAVPW